MLFHSHSHLLKYVDLSMQSGASTITFHFIPLPPPPSLPIAGHLLGFISIQKNVLRKCLGSRKHSWVSKPLFIWISLCLYLTFLTYIISKISFPYISWVSKLIHKWYRGIVLLLQSAKVWKAENIKLWELFKILCGTTHKNIHCLLEFNDL